MSTVSVERDFAILENYLTPESNHWDVYTDEQELCPKRARGWCFDECIIDGVVDA